MLEKIISLDYMLEKVIVALGILILALYRLFLRHSFVLFLSSKNPEKLAEITSMLLEVVLLILIAFFIFFLKQKNKIKELKQEFLYRSFKINKFIKVFLQYPNPRLNPQMNIRAFKAQASGECKCLKCNKFIDSGSSGWRCNCKNKQYSGEEITNFLESARDRLEEVISSLHRS